MLTQPPEAPRFDPRRSLALDRAITTLEASHSSHKARTWARFSKALIEQCVPAFQGKVKAVQS